MSGFFNKIIDKAKQASQGHIQLPQGTPGVALPLSPPASTQNSFSAAPPKGNEDPNRMSVDESDFSLESMPLPSTASSAKPVSQQAPTPAQPLMDQPQQELQEMIYEQQVQERLTSVPTPNSPPLTPTTPTVSASGPVSSNPAVTITEHTSSLSPSTNAPSTEVASASQNDATTAPTTSTPQNNGSSPSVFNDNAMIQQRQSRPKLKLADFHLLRTLGTGSFGRVHLSQSRVNHRFYAIKVLKKSEVVRLKQVEHTNNEKQILERVAHPFLVNLWGTFQDDGNLYMVMDYVPGGELFSVLRKSQRFPDHVAKFYAAEVILAIEYLHSKDIIYRDLKPENLLLDAQGHIKITDFGFAKYVPDITWTLCGTPDYLAPEIIQSKGYGKAVDWYSLGVLIFEMLAGYPPFYDDDHLKLYEKILLGKIRWPSYFDPYAKDLLKRLLATDLSKRYGNLKGGSDDIKRHKWFEGVDFGKVLRRDIRAPYVPQIRGEGDASHFDRYPEETEPYGQDQPDPYREKFLDF